jgi:chaperonin GroES
VDFYLVGYRIGGTYIIHNNQIFMKAKKTMKATKKSFGLEPLGDKILVSEISSEDSKKTGSGIYIPDSAKEEKGAKKGKVIAVGKGRFEDGKHIPVQVSVGDTILFTWGDQIKYEGAEYFLVRESEVSAKITNN